jgi:copper resistance protein B
VRAAVVGLIAMLTAAGIAPPVRAQGHHGSEQARPDPKPEETSPVPGTPERSTAGQPPAIPPLTDADRRAAFPDVKGHAVHDEAVHAFVLFDQLEWQGSEAGGINLDSRGWVGRDRDRLWFRSEVESDDGRVNHAEAHVLYGRAVARWWELVAGIRQDMRPGPARTWAALGMQGLAPYWLEIEATAYLSGSGHTAARLKVEHELLLTNRLIAQPLVEMNLYGKADPERGIGAGLSDLEAGLRVRYEFRREVAPYAGVTWTRRFGETREHAARAGERVGGARLAAGLRFWY